MLFFFFQAEDGIRDVAVTGVQTCALPICEGAPAATGISWRPTSARKRSRSFARVSVSPKVVVMPMICNSGLRRESAMAKASSMSSPISVSMITFSGRAGAGEDWPLLVGEAIRNAQTTMEMRTAVDLDICKRWSPVGHGAEWGEQIFLQKIWCGREDSNLHALRR